MRELLTGLSALAMLASSPAHADRVEDAIESQDRTDADRALDEGRMPAEVLHFADIQKGETVADFMAGGGYYTVMIADLVGPEGTVYALNPATFHNEEEWAARTASHSNIRPIATGNRALVFPPDSVNTIFSHLTFHDIYWESERFQMERIDEGAMLANWFAALKPGGQVIVVDHFGPSGDTREVVDAYHRINPATVIADMEVAGFVLAGQSDMLRRSDDNPTISVFDASVRGKTDRFVMKFHKPVK
ncbi:methyltransferase [Altererythrobacter sp.]|uniref:class I SAM-dependent methyltransferase n=1 Tax=Altererythrobacter sp. TaxID=1872480 RepID=UPI001B10F04B|nr:methyltransferase [Altererythrobacter sp.]MBO6944406.1 class I SAM-dependent methyltransferase [Altererythrobacter sp.]